MQSMDDPSSTPREPPASPLPKHRLGELALLFLRLGTTAFGGPAAHIAMMQEEVVVRRGWLTSVEFLDMMAATNFIPGPNSTELAIHIGHRRAGWKGLLVAGSCFIVPAAVMCTGIAALYVRFGRLPFSQSMLYCVKPVVIAVIVQALVKLGRAAIKSPSLAAVGAAALLGLALGVHELAVLFGAGLLTLLLTLARRPRERLPLLCGFPPALLASGPAFAATAAATGPAVAPLGALFGVFLKIGSVLFGSGYVLLAFLRADLVERHHWLTEQKLLDAIAVGQVTPGPVFTTATFIGYILSGPAGALVATLGIFIPAFFFVAVSAPFLPALRRSALAGAFLDGLNAGSLALMAMVTLELARTTLIVPGGSFWLGRIDGIAAGLALASWLLLAWRHVNSAWIVLGAAALGAARAWWLGI
jgi:chromate transporter